MPRYFFDVQDGDRTIDEEGIVLDSPNAVEAEALRTLLEIGQFEAVRKNERELSITARDEAGTEVYRTELTIRAGWLTPTGSTKVQETR